MEQSDQDFQSCPCLIPKQFITTEMSGNCKAFQSLKACKMTNSNENEKHYQKFEK